MLLQRLKSPLRVRRPGRCLHQSYPSLLSPHNARPLLLRPFYTSPVHSIRIIGRITTSIRPAYHFLGESRTITSTLYHILASTIIPWINPAATLESITGIPLSPTLSLQGMDHRMPHHYRSAPCKTPICKDLAPRAPPLDYQANRLRGQHKRQYLSMDKAYLLILLGRAVKKQSTIQPIFFTGSRVRYPTCIYFSTATVRPLGRSVYVKTSSGKRRRK